MSDPKPKNRVGWRITLDIYTRGAESRLFSVLTGALLDSDLQFRSGTAWDYEAEPLYAQSPDVVVA